MEKPNFWSSWAVAMYSWVWASTPAVTRTITPGGAAELVGDTSASRSISWKESTMIRPTPSSTARSSSRRRLVVAVEADPLHREAGPLGDEQLAAGADVEREPVLGQPARRRSCRGRPCRRSRRRSRRRRRGRRGPGRGSRPRPGRTPVSRARGPARAAALPRPTSTPSALAAVCDQRCGDERVGVGRLTQPGGPAQGAVGVRPAGRVGGGHDVTSARGRRPRAGTGRWRAPPGSRRRAEPGPVQVAGLLVAARQHPAAVVEAVVGAGQLLEVARDAVRLAQLGGGLDDPRELGERPQQLALLLVRQQLGVRLGRRRPGRPRCASGSRRGRGRTAR